ncbi:MAG TPA: AI-2E family transporter [Bryobacteraceae bacterium]|nr:AI-2E family transporter [Bryobacteraceae bacterium]
MVPSGNPFRQSVRVLGLFIRSQLIIASIDTILYATGFAIAHVPWWPLFALIGGFCSFIPSIGSLIPLTLVGVTMLLADRNWTDLAIAFGAWLVVQVLEGFVLQPVLLSRPLGLGALAVFLALLAGSVFFGPVGFLLAVPVLAVANVFWRHFRDRDLERSPGKHGP